MILLSTTGCATSEPNPPNQPLDVPRSGITFHLGQPWNATPDAGFAPGDTRLSWTPDALHVEANLTDRNVISSSTGDNQRTWELGDVFEMFLQLEGRPGFAELHVTPNAYRTELDLPGPRGRVTPDSAPLPFEQMLVRPIRFQATATRTSTGWRVSAAIPPITFGLERFAVGQRFRVNFSRYDASRDQAPILSTTAAHPKIDFHHPEEWTPVVLIN